MCPVIWGGGGVNFKALNFLTLYKSSIFQCLSQILCMELQREPLKFHIRYFAHTFNKTEILRALRFRSSQVFVQCPPPPPPQPPPTQILRGCVTIKVDCVKVMGRFHQAYRRSDVGTCALGRLPFTQRSFTFKRFRHTLPHWSHVCRRF